MSRIEKDIWVPEFLKSLNSFHKEYNPELRMLRRPFKSPGYHTTIKAADFVHPTRDALLYAVALLDSGLSEYRERAFHIIDQVVSLQDTDRSSHTFGIWSWFYEEPLEQMSPPDWNWADFCGKQLLLAVSRYADLFPQPLLDRTKQAIYNSCDAIIKRNVGPEYTNIAIMGAFVTLIAGECFGEERYRSYGLDRLERFYLYTKQQGSFSEYNSPTYAIVSIEELSSIATETQNAEARLMVAEVLDIAWSMVAYHFHPRLRQWSGPHSRAYETLLPPEKLSFLQLACDGEVEFLPEQDFKYGITWYGNQIKCPDKYYSLFTEHVDRESNQPVSKPKEDGREKRATLYMDSTLSLGTFNCNIMWNQSRNLLAYIANGSQSTYIHLRVLHDGYDYSSAVFTSVQKQGSVLFGINFATDGGGTHPNLDRVNGRIVASDLRVRFELGGNQDNIRIEKQGGRVDVCIESIRVTLEAMYGLLGEKTDFEWEISEDGLRKYVDLVIYSGDSQSFDFHQISCAGFLFACMINRDDNAHTKEVVRQEDHIRSRVATSDGTELELNLPIKPDTLATLLNFQP